MASNPIGSAAPKTKRGAGSPNGASGLKTSFDLIGDWEKAMRGTRTLGLDGAINRAVRQEAALAERIIKQNMTGGGAPAGAPFAKLSAWTMAGRRLSKPSIKGSKPLMARGDMRNSVTNVVVYDGKRETVAFVGVLKQAIGGKPGNPRMVNVAGVHEFGKTIVIRMTPKMRKFLAILAKEAGHKQTTKPGKGTSTKQFLVVHVPARPFIRPAFDLWQKGAGDRMQKRILKLTGGALGT